MPQPPVLVWLDPVHAMHNPRWFASETPSHLQLDRLATHPNDKAASPASRVQQTLAFLAVGSLTNHPLTRSHQKLTAWDHTQEIEHPPQGMLESTAVPGRAA